MREITLPANELNSFDLPPVCVVTGQTEGVEFRSVKFSWYPRWVAALILLNLLIAAIVAMALTKKVQGELPFTEQAWKAWKRGQLLFTLSGVGCIGLLIGAIVLLADEHTALGFLTVLLAIALPIVVGVGFLRRKGPSVQRIAEGRITLKLPSDEAAQRIEQHLVAGARRSQGRMAEPLMRSA